VNITGVVLIKFLMKATYGVLSKCIT